MVIGKLQTVVRRHLGDEIPPLYELSRNVSFILQNSHFSVSYPRAFMPNVAEIACIHCKPAQPLPNVRKSNVIILEWHLKPQTFHWRQDLEDFISGAGDFGFIYVSMGSSVKAANMPENLRQLLVNTFAKLPYRVLWKYESTIIQNDLPPNVKISRWLPQQDVLGHKKLRAFITHGKEILNTKQNIKWLTVPFRRWPTEHVRNGISRGASGCYARVLRSRCQLWESEGGWLWYEQYSWLWNCNWQFVQRQLPINLFSAETSLGNPKFRQVVQSDTCCDTRREVPPRGQVSDGFIGTRFRSFTVSNCKHFLANRYRQSLLRDQKHTPLETAIYWTEYVIRHRGAYHLQTPGRHMG